MKNSTFLSISLLTLGLIVGQAHALTMLPPGTTQKPVTQMPAATTKVNQTSTIPVIKEEEIDIIEEPEKSETLGQKAENFGHKFKTDVKKGWEDFKGIFDGKEKKERKSSAKNIVFHRLCELYKNNKEEFNTVMQKLNLTNEEREKVEKTVAKKATKSEREAKTQPKVEKFDVVAVTTDNK